MSNSPMKMKKKRRFQVSIRIGVNTKTQLVETLKMLANTPGRLPVTGEASTGALVNIRMTADAEDADVQEIMPIGKGWGT